MKRNLCLVICFLFAITMFGQGTKEHGRIVVSSNMHFLQYEDGTPFFWLGDTAWELFHRLRLDEIEKYLDDRSAKGFNVIQAVVLAEMDGLRKMNQHGDVPLINLDPLKPNEKYFHFVDTVISMADKRNMCIGLLPTWGDKITQMWGVGPVIFNNDNAYQYGKWIGDRYKNCKNIIWILGGDRPARKDSNDWRPVWRAMANGILEATNNKATIAYHPSGGDYSTSQFIQEEPWLNINMFQSGHGGGHDVPAWEYVKRDWNLLPIRPTLDAEPNYEDHPVNPWPTWDPANGYFRDYDVRKQCYRSVFAGACGVTYGHHSIWQFYNPREEKINYADRYWTEALNRPGAVQVGYLRRLIESRPMINRFSDESIIKKGQGEKGEHICAFRDGDGNYLMVYLPVGKSITIDAKAINSEKVIASWFNPRNGKIENSYELERKDEMEFTSPTQGVENDWVLIVDKAK